MNPALFSDTLTGQAWLSYMPYFGNTGYFNASGVGKLPKVGALHFSFRHFGYGAIDGYDAAGVPTGTFTAGESSLVIGKGMRAGNFSFGINTKLDIAGIAGNYASALAIDLGGAFFHPVQDFSVGMVFTNMGMALSEFTETSRSTLPMDIRVGISYKPEHMPFRFLFSGYHLLPYSKAYFNFFRQELSGIKRMMSHINLGGELFLNNTIQLLVGYNFLRRYEMMLENKAGGAGMSLGMRLQRRGFIFEYGYARVHVAGSAHHITFGFNMRGTIKRNKGTKE